MSLGEAIGPHQTMGNTPFQVERFLLDNMPVSFKR